MALVEEGSFVPDMERRNIMNLVLLFGGVLPAVGGLAIPYVLFFIPSGGGGGGGGLPALTKAGDAVTFDSWLGSHKVGDRELVQGLKGDATYLIVDEDKTIRDYGINAVCTHLGCVVPWNKAANKYMCPCHGSQYDQTGKVRPSVVSRGLSRLRSMAGPASKKRATEHASQVTPTPVAEALEVLDARDLRRLLCLDDEAPLPRHRRPPSPFAETSAAVVAHVRQRMAWDCGLACVLMVLSAAEFPRYDATWDRVHAACGTRSVWTVDLAFALKAFGVRFVFATKTLGCDPSYRDMSFYKRELSLDERRVAGLFERAFAGEICLRKGTVPSDALGELLGTHRALVIALVDLRFLYSRTAVGRAIASLPYSYTGHYIVLTGLDAAGRVLYKDPASAGEDHAIGLADLHRARAAHGTDEDLILVAVDSLSRTHEPPPGRGTFAGGIRWRLHRRLGLSTQ
ncbi:guanylylate cyclase [Aureococcus anophagefferens]|nr:guanylylate cyclase [Aureococcus anophagefferens]